MFMCDLDLQKQSAKVVQLLGDCPQRTPTEALSLDLVLRTFSL